MTCQAGTRTKSQSGVKGRSPLEDYLRLEAYEKNSFSLLPSRVPVTFRFGALESGSMYGRVQAIELSESVI